MEMIVPLYILSYLGSVALIFFIVIIFIKKRDKEKIALKDEFTTVLIHKFRTSLSHIKWNTENILKDGLPEEAKLDIVKIQQSALHMVSLTNLLIDFSDSEKANYEYKFEKVNLREVVEDTIKDFSARAKSKKVDLSIQSDEAVVRIDTLKTKLAVEILFENALTYTPEGGSVTAKIIKDKGEAILSIKDTGIGISKEGLTHIFSKFYRGNESTHIHSGGMGIGLFMAQKIVERQGGKISVDSEGPGLGSTFSIRFPLKK